MIGLACALALVSLQAGKADTLLMSDDFEAYGAGAFPQPPWIPDANAESNPDNNKVISDGANKMLQLFGSDSFNWSSLAFRACTLTADTELKFRVYIDDSFDGQVGVLGLVARSGPNWLYPGYGIVGFDRSDMKTKFSDVAVADFSFDRWYSVKIRRTRVGTLVTSTLWLDGVQAGSAATQVTEDFRESDFGYVSFDNRGRVLLDDVQITAKGPDWRYAVVVSDVTWASSAWRDVAESLCRKHHGRLIMFSGSAFPEALRATLADQMPDYVCFVAQPQEATAAFVQAAHQMLRKLDADLYGDAIWGIVTGADSVQAMRLAQVAGPLTVRNALMKTAGDWLGYLRAGTYHSETDSGTWWTRTSGGAIDKRSDGPLDDTVPLVNALNAGDVDMVVTSGHASEYNWQLHYPSASPEGYFLATNGQLYGQDAGGARHDINSANAKIYYAPGNCLIAHIPEDGSRGNSMSLAWLNTGGAVQMAGYTVTTAYGYMGWGVAEYFVKLQDRWTFAESCHLNNQALLFDDVHDTPGVSATALDHDRDVFVLYGDPAYVSRMEPATQPDYAQDLQYTSAAGVTSFTLTIRMNRAVNVARPVIARLPFHVRNPRVTDGGGRTLDVVDDMVLVNIWHDGEASLTSGQTWTLRFTGERPADDYGVWAGECGLDPQWTDGDPACDGRTGSDPDKDGMTNQAEYFFALNPTNAASVTPITSGLVRATGHFNYTRRDPTVTGVTFSIETSTTLGPGLWCTDTGAVQHVIDAVGDTQTAEVTLSSALLAAPRLFVRVVATGQ